MARIRRIKKEGDAHYHVMSRTNGKAFLARDYKFSSQNSEAAALYAAFSFPAPTGVRFPGPVPAPEAQIGAGVVFGSRGFVTAQIGGFAACFHGESVRVRPVFGAACASYGHRLAALVGAGAK